MESSYSFDICVGFGSNLEDTENNLLKAINAVVNEIPGVVTSGVSSVYLTSPVENTNQPYFLNCAVLFRLAGQARRFPDFPAESGELLGKQLLFILKKIEKNMGRKNENERYMPRIIDADLLFIYDNASKDFITLDTPGLKLPHAGIFHRKFALYPILDLSAPGYLKKPFDEESIKKALAKLENSDAGASQKISYHGKFDENLTRILR